MISSTLNQYKESFKTNLLTFLNEYEDNTKTFFLQNEKNKYQAYQNALTKIVDQMKFFTREELNQNLVHRNIASGLKRIDQNIYNSIITEFNPAQDETILSLSAVNKDRIKINEIELDNHIKSSIVILKFISEANTDTNDVSKYTYAAEDGETGLKFQTNEQLDVNLEKWLNNYEANFEYLHIPMIIEEKAYYVTDTYKNYEQRYFEYQIEVCNTILKTVPSDKIIIDFKRKFENNLIELRKHYPIPSVNIETIISDINNAFFRLENFMKGSVSIYQSFLFNDAFTIFFNELNKIENITVKNHNLRDGYHYLLSQIDYAFDKSEFKNHNAYENDDFNRDCNEIGYIHFNRSSEFGINVDLDDYKFEMPSIMDIVNDSISAFDQNIDKVLEPKQILETENYTKSFGENKAENHIHKQIIDIFNYPINFLSNNDYGDFKGYDEKGLPIYVDVDIPDMYNYNKDIEEPFSKLENLTIELMESTKHSKVLDGYLKKIFKEFMETFVIVLNYYNFDLLGVNGDKYPKNLSFYFYIYKYQLSRYYDFIVEFFDDSFLEIENKIVVNELGYYSKVHSESITVDKIYVNSNTVKNETKEKKLPEKWYALLYLLELKATNSKPPTNIEGSFVRSEIEEIGSKRTGSTGQNFYRQILIINDLINSNSLLVGMFNNKWKETIITLSNNDKIVIDYIEKHY